ncbi:MAG: sugar phosphate isomerase/epimerase family protein [Isosphaerales bacterium]
MAGRPLGTMVTYGYRDIDLDAELELAVWIGASLLEILPGWSRLPDPALVRRSAADRGLAIHSAHGCWGGQTIRARRVDLGATEPSVHHESVEDLKRCVDWLQAAGGTHLVVHPGGLSDPADSLHRRSALARGLLELAQHASGTKVIVCVENMPPGVHPGSRMAELAELVAGLGQSNLGLALDTGHANLNASASEETRAAGSLLATTHVHDNDGQHDSHDPPGHGTIDWADWGRALDSAGYNGPILLECIRRIRQSPSTFKPEILAGIARIVPTGPLVPDRL